MSGRRSFLPYPAEQPGGAGGGGGGGGGSSLFSLVYRPGGVAGPNVFTTWATLIMAASAIQGPKLVTIDDTDGATTVPAGSWDLFGWIIQGVVPFGDPASAGKTTQLLFQNGATIAPGGLPYLVQFASLVSQNTTGNVFTAPVVAPKAPPAALIIGDAGTVATDSTTPGALPFFHSPDGASLDLLLLIGASLGDGTASAWVVDDATGQSGVLLAGFQATVEPNALSGAGAVSVLLSAQGQVGTPQAITTLNVGPTNVNTAYLIGKLAGSTPSTSPLAPGIASAVLTGNSTQLAGTLVITNGAAVLPPESLLATVSFSDELPSGSDLKVQLTAGNQGAAEAQAWVMISGPSQFQVAATNSIGAGAILTFFYQTSG
jgi:hypothetical protein